jgi:hypothetical protein
MGIEAAGGPLVSMAMQLGAKILEKLSQVAGSVMDKLGKGDLQGAMADFGKAFKLTEMLDKLTKMMGGGSKGAEGAQDGGLPGMLMKALGAGGADKAGSAEGIDKAGGAEGAGKAQASTMPDAPPSPLFGQEAATTAPPAAGPAAATSGAAMEKIATPDAPKSEVDAGREERSEGLAEAADHGTATGEKLQFGNGQNEGAKKAADMDPKDALKDGNKLIDKAEKETDPEEKAYLQGKAKGMIDTATKNMDKQLKGD